MSAKFLKTAKEKLETKLAKLSIDKNVIRKKNSFYVNKKLLLKITNSELLYGIYRYKPANEEKISIVNNLDSVRIKITHENLDFLNTNILNPPNKVNVVFSVFKQLEGKTIKHIVLDNQNKIDNDTIHIDHENYKDLIKIDREESIEKSQKVFNRFIPFLKSNFNVVSDELNSNIDYSLLLKEIIASKQINQQDIINLTENLENGSTNQVVIEKQITKQTKWLIDTIEEILEEKNLTTIKAKAIGNQKFGFLKTAITGPEHLMEKILSEYGQFCIFGVPALLNTNKYVIRKGRSRSQFDLILINHLGDVEVVELKRPDKHLLEYGGGRGKFYPTKDLAIAISQTERYLTSLYKDNDVEYKIDGKTLREFLNEQIGNTLHVETIRPKGLIIMGSWENLCVDYDSLDDKTKAKVSKADYNADSLQAYKELTASLKNITILTYSELLENARTRLEIEKSDIS